MVLTPIGSSISSEETEIDVEVTDCYGLMSEEKANRLTAMELKFVKDYVESDEE